MNANHITPTFKTHYRIVKNLVRMAMSDEPEKIHGWNEKRSEVWRAFMKDVGMIRCVRGSGGYVLATPATAITLSDVDRLVSQSRMDVEIGHSPIDLAIAQVLHLPDMTIQDLAQGQGAEMKSPIHPFAPHYLHTQNLAQMAMRATPSRITRNFALENHFTPTFKTHHLVAKNLVRMAMSDKPVRMLGVSQSQCWVEKWAAALKKWGLIKSFRGGLGMGGYMLAVPACEITLNDVDRLVSQNRRGFTMDESPIDLAIAQALRLPDVTIQDLANSASASVGEP